MGPASQTGIRADEMRFGANGTGGRRLPVALAIVHHANQYIISDGYTNRCGIQSVVGGTSAKRGLAYILELHRRHQVPANIHVSGTLLESLAWFQPSVTSADLVNIQLAIASSSPSPAALDRVTA